MASKKDDILGKLGTSPCAIIFESQSSIESIVGDAKRISKEDDVLIAVKEAGALEKRFLPAYINAYLRYHEKSMHSSSISLETMLFLAGNMNITNAIGKVGADKSRFVLFSSRKELAAQLARKCNLRKIREIRLVLDYDIASDVAMTAIKDYK